MTARYVLGRICFFIAIVWVTATVNFVVPRLAPGDPIESTVARMASTGQSVVGADQMIRSYRHRLGLDAPLAVQYGRYLKSAATMDLGLSASQFPVPVRTLIANALPWSIGLLAISTILAFGIGSVLGALMSWPGTPRAGRLFLSPFLFLAAVPYYLLAIALAYFCAFKFSLFPSSGATSPGTTVSLNGHVLVDLVRHATLPALSIILGGIGAWMLSMRGMMIMTLGADHMVLAEAKGLRSSTIFFRHGLRIAILPQITALTIAFGYIVSGAVLVEVIFGYPGIGGLFYQAIRSNDFPLIQGISFVIAVSLAFAILLLDLLYPLIDPRISYRKQ